MHRGGPLVLIVGFCAACSGPKPVPADCALVVRSGLLPPGALFPSMPALVTAGAQFVGCDTKLQVTAAVSVVGPDDQAVATTFTTEVVPSTFLLSSQLSKDASDAGALTDGLIALAHVTFVPPQPGSYHLTVRFDPGLGTVQADVTVFDDRRPAAFQTLPMPFQCDDFDLQLGVGLCLIDGAVLTVVDGGDVASITAMAFAADGANLWTVTPTSNDAILTLLSLAPSGSVTTVASSPILGTHGDTSAMLRSSGQRVGVVTPLGSTSQMLMFEAWSDGGIAFGNYSSLWMETGSAALQWAPGAGAVLGGTLSFGGRGQPDHVCELSLLDGGVGCAAGVGNDPGPLPLGSDGAALWSQSSSGQLTAWSARAEGGFTAITVPFGLSPSFLPLASGGNSSGPVIRDDSAGGIVLPSTAAPYLLQAYGFPQAVTTVPSRWGSSSKLYWEWHPDDGGTLVYFER